MPIDILNKACHGYLNQLAQIETSNIDPKRIRSRTERAKYQRIFKILNKYKDLDYDENVDYKAVYQKLHEAAESLKYNVHNMRDRGKGEPLKTFHQAFFLKLFENDNKIHEEIYTQVIQAQPHDKPTSDLNRIKEDLKTRSKRPFTGLAHPEHGLNRFFSGLLGIAYHPLKKNNVPYISFDHENKGQKNLRFGAQINGLGTVNKSFKQFLAAKKAQAGQSEKRFHHLYINLQKRDMKEGGKFERYFEKKRSLALEKLEQDEKLGVAVVTLPADSHFFFQGFSHGAGISTSDKQTKLDDIRYSLTTAIQENTHDFYMSPEVKKTVLGDPIQNEVAALFRQSAEEILGRKYDPSEMVDPAVRQAIVFHFVKYHLTNKIIQAINPSTYNISCKDNIDRGGVHNLWYEMTSKINDGEQITQAEFERNLDASAILVKDRPVNDHRNVVWNAMYQQFINNPAKISESMPWIAEWLTKNIPLEKGFEKQLSEKGVSHIKISKSLKTKMAERLNKPVKSVKDSEVIELIQKDALARANEIAKVNYDYKVSTLAKLVSEFNDPETSQTRKTEIADRIKTYQADKNPAMRQVVERELKSNKELNKLVKWSVEPSMMEPSEGKPPILGAYRKNREEDKQNRERAKSDDVMKIGKTKPSSDRHNRKSF